MGLKSGPCGGPAARRLGGSAARRRCIAVVVGLPPHSSQLRGGRRSSPLTVTHGVASSRTRCRVRSRTVLRPIALATHRWSELSREATSPWLGAASMSWLTARSPGIPAALRPCGRAALRPCGNAWKRSWVYCPIQVSPGAGDAARRCTVLRPVAHGVASGPAGHARPGRVIALGAREWTSQSPSRSIHPRGRRRASPAGRLAHDHRSICPFAGPYGGCTSSCPVPRSSGWLVGPGLVKLSGIRTSWTVR